MYSAKVTIDGVVTNVLLTYLDTVLGQDRHQGVVPNKLLIRVDVWGSFLSLAVYNAFNHVEAGHINHFSIEFNGETTTFDNFRYMCGFRKTYGTHPPVVYDPAIIGTEPQSAPFDWSEPPIAPMDYGKFIEPYAETGGRPMLGVREMNFVQDASARVRYANQGLGLPFHAISPVAPYEPIMADGFVMGLNTFSMKGKFTLTQLGRKVECAHLSSQFLSAAIFEQDRIYIDEVIALGNYAAMYTTGLGTSQVRQQGRTLIAAIFAWLFSKNAVLYSKIKKALDFYETKVNDISSIQYGRRLDPALNKYYMAHWEYAYLSYALFLSEQVGLIQKSNYLRAFMNYQKALGTIAPYWSYLSGNVPVETDIAFIKLNYKGFREDSARVIGFVMEELGVGSPWDLSLLLNQVGKWPVKNHVDFKIIRPKLSVPGVFQTYMRSK